MYNYATWILLVGHRTRVRHVSDTNTPPIRPRYVQVRQLAYRLSWRVPTSLIRSPIPRWNVRHGWIRSGYALGSWTAPMNRARARLIHEPNLWTGIALVSRSCEPACAPVSRAYTGTNMTFFQLSVWVELGKAGYGAKPLTTTPKCDICLKLILILFNIYL